MSLDIEQLRRTEFPWAARGDAIYLNNASTGPLPERARRALDEYNAVRAEPYRLTDEMQFGTLARGRELIATMIGAAPEEIALCVNTTFGINLAAFSLPLERGDVVLAPDLEFPANVYPWMHLERERGVVYRRIEARDGVLDEPELLAQLDDQKVKVLAVSWTGFATGYTVDLPALGRACRERGIHLVVDAIQGLGARTLDMRECGADILSCGAQKWLLSPWGTGFTYVRRELIPKLQPQVVSWMAVKDSDDFSRLLNYDLAWRDDARRYELITLPYQDFAGMNASLELFAELGPHVVAQRVAQLADEIVRWAADRDDVALVTPRSPAHRAGIVALRPRDPFAASARLKNAGVVHSLREGMIRLSPHFYNTIEEVRGALTVLAEDAGPGR